MVPFLTELVGLPGIDVELYEETQDGLILSVEAHSETATCPRCETLSRHLHQNHGYLVRDLPLSRCCKTWLRVNRRQVKSLSGQYRSFRPAIKQAQCGARVHRELTKS